MVAKKPVQVIEAMTKRDYANLRDADAEKIKAEIAATETEAERQKRLYREANARARGDLA